MVQFFKMSSAIHLDLKVDSDNSLKDCLRVLKLVKSHWDEAKIQSKVLLPILQANILVK